MGKLSDIETSARIKLALITNPNIGGFDVGVETVNGIVVLTGTVERAEQKNLATEIAVQNGGIDVKNDIKLPEDLSIVDDPGLMRKVAQQATFFTEDNSVRQRVLGDLESDPRVNSATINVDEVAGIVRLSGFQESDYARERAEEIAYRVVGVHRVVNDIEVRESEWESAA